MPLEIIKSEDGVVKTPHLALCHELQGGSANLRHASLMMKAEGIEITEEISKALESLGLVEKASMFKRDLESMLFASVKEKFGGDYGWAYVEDYNDSVVIFSTDDGLYSSNYSIDGNSVTLDDLAKPITSVISYVETSGEMLLSEDAEEKLESGEYELVVKCVANPKTTEHLFKMFENLKQKETKLMDEIQKAVAAAEEILKAQLSEKEQELEKALNKIKDFEQAQAQAVSNVRKSRLEKAVGSDKAEALFKSIESLDDEAFDNVVKAFEATNKALETSELFVEKGVSDQGDEDVLNETAKILKAQFATKAQ